jgi:glycine cleavage system transcriptional repressor
MNYYTLWAVGPDRKGIVAAVTEALYRSGCNLEDCSMMRLGSEFGVLIIYTGSERGSSALKSRLEGLRRRLKLEIGLKKISRQLARFQPLKRRPVMVRVNGFDRPGLVHAVTKLLAAQNFNITDLASHRTGGKNAGYILLIEGELPSASRIPALSRALNKLAQKMRVRISVEDLAASTL